MFLFFCLWNSSRPRARRPRGPECLRTHLSITDEQRVAGQCPASLPLGWSQSEACSREFPGGLQLQLPTETNGLLKPPHWLPSLLSLFPLPTHASWHHFLNKPFASEVSPVSASQGDLPQDTSPTDGKALRPAQPLICASPRETSPCPVSRLFTDPTGRSFQCSQGSQDSSPTQPHRRVPAAQGGVWTQTLLFR